MQDALDNIRPSLGANHQTVAIYTLTLGAIQMARRQPRLAEPLFREGLRVRALAPDRRARAAAAPFAKTTGVSRPRSPHSRARSSRRPALPTLSRCCSTPAASSISHRPARPDDIKVTTSRLIDLLQRLGQAGPGRGLARARRVLALIPKAALRRHDVSPSRA